jgi:hypothetical protein
MVFGKNRTATAKQQQGNRIGRTRKVVPVVKQQYALPAYEVMEPLVHAFSTSGDK